MILQKHWRRYKERKNFLIRLSIIKNAVRIIEHAWIEFRHRKVQKHVSVNKKKAAKIIQRYYSRFSARRKILKQIEAIQKRECERKATIIIQSHFRSFLLRKRIRKALQASKEQSVETMLKEMDLDALDFDWFHSNLFSLADSHSIDQNQLDDIPEKASSDAKDAETEWKFQNEEAARNFHRSWKRQKFQKTQKQRRRRLQDPEVA